MMMPRLFALALAAVLMAAPTARAQEADAAAAAPRIANGTPFGNWLVTCEAVAVNETTCVLTQRLSRSTDNAFLAEYLAFWSGDGTKRYIVVRVPNGVYLPAGVAIRPEADPEDAEIDFVWQSCGRDLCEALIELDDELAARLDGAEKLLAGYRPNIQAETLVFPLSFAGLEEGLAALRPTTP